MVQVVLITPTGSEPHWIVRTLRERGKKIPRFVWAAGEEDPPIGVLQIGWEQSERHHRGMHVARLLRFDDGPVPLPMRDVRIVEMRGHHLTLTGFEEVEDREYAQSWFCRIAIAGWKPRGKPSEPVGRWVD